MVATRAALLAAAALVAQGASAFTAPSLPRSSSQWVSLRRQPSNRLSMSHEIAEIANPAMLYAQLAGCGGLLGAGYKLLGDGEGPEHAAEGPVEGAEVDLFRDTPVRYLGYANEVGEAFRPLIPAYIVVLSYAVAIAYVSADAIAKGYQCSQLSSEACKAAGKPNACAFPATLDVLLFQMLASVVFPGFTINRWVTFVGFMQSQALHLEDKVPPAVYEYLPTAAGLALIPFIVKPLDTLVEKVLDVTVRPLLVSKFPLCDLETIFGEEALYAEQDGFF